VDKLWITPAASQKKARSIVDEGMSYSGRMVLAEREGYEGCLLNTLTVITPEGIRSVSSQCSLPLLPSGLEMLWLSRQL
jgi:hypothetical protein